MSSRWHNGRGRRCLLVAVLLLAWALVPVATRAASAASIALGVVSFDVFIPGDAGAPGVNAINIFNLTGDPFAGGFALDPDFPSYTSVTLLGASLTLVVDGVTQVTPLGDIGPGLLDPPAELLFPDTAVISALTFSATLSATDLLLGDGTTFVAGSSALTLALFPSAGGALVPGVDFGVISVEESLTSTPVPEPGTLALLALGLSGLGVRHTRHRKVPRA